MLSSIPAEGIRVLSVIVRYNPYGICSLIRYFSDSFSIKLFFSAVPILTHLHWWIARIFEEIKSKSPFSNQGKEVSNNVKISSLGGRNRRVFTGINCIRKHIQLKSFIFFNSVPDFFWIACSEFLRSCRNSFGDRRFIDL